MYLNTTIQVKLNFKPIAVKNVHFFLRIVKNEIDHLPSLINILLHSDGKYLCI